tara:strand:- start:381 stop:557 length:177 start_codon:yes stop_codon:yes gene_type:complete
MIKNILVISNDKSFNKNDVISSDYNDTVYIVEGLAKKNRIFTKEYFQKEINKIVLWQF